MKLVFIRRISSKHYRYYSSKLKRHISTKILRISHLPPKMSSKCILLSNKLTIYLVSFSAKALRESLRNLFIDFKKPSHLLKIKILNDYAFLIFQQSEDIDRALHYLSNRSLNGIKLKAEPYDESMNSKQIPMKTFDSDDFELDEYSVKATRTLYIGNLQPEISYQELRDIYSIYGEIIVRLRKPKQKQCTIFYFRKLKSNDSKVNIHKYLHLFNMPI